MNKIIGTLCCIAFLWSCGPTKPKDEKVKDDHMITFKFVQLNDVYEIAPMGGGKHGGMARVAHVVDSIKKQNNNTYLVHAGDFLNPSLLGTLKYNGERIRGKQMVEVMNAMGFELVTFGNHEFDLPMADLQKRMNESNFYWTSANCFQQLEDGPRSFHFVRNGDSIPIPETYTIAIKDADGTAIEVGMFSVTLASNPQDFVYYADEMLETRSAISSLQMHGVDVIVGLTHVTIDSDIEIAKAHPEIAFIMGGHEHNNMLVETGNARIAKADANAETVYIHTFLYNTETKDLKIDSRLFPITDKIPEKQEIKEIVDKWENILLTQVKEVTDKPNEVIYYANPPLDATDISNRSQQTNWGQLVVKSMMVAFNEPVDAALVNGGSFRLDDMLHDEITQLDIFRVLPFGGGLLKVDLKGDLLKEVLNYGQSKVGNGAYLHRYNFSKDTDGNWLIQNKPIIDSEVYTVAFSDFLLKGLDIPFLKPDNPGVVGIYNPTSEEPAFDIRKAIIVYLKSVK